MLRSLNKLSQPCSRSFFQSKRYFCAGISTKKPDYDEVMTMDQFKTEFDKLFKFEGKPWTETLPQEDPKKAALEIDLGIFVRAFFKNLARKEELTQRFFQERANLIDTDLKAYTREIKYLSDCEFHIKKDMEEVSKDAGKPDFNIEERLQDPQFAKAINGFLYQGAEFQMLFFKDPEFRLMKVDQAQNCLHKILGIIDNFFERSDLKSIEDKTNQTVDFGKIYLRDKLALDHNLNFNAFNPSVLMKTDSTSKKISKNVLLYQRVDLFITEQV